MKAIIERFLLTITFLAFVYVFGAAGAVENDALTLGQGLIHIAIAFAVMFATGALAMKLEDETV